MGRKPTPPISSENFDLVPKGETEIYGSMGGPVGPGGGGGPTGFGGDNVGPHDFYINPNQRWQPFLSLAGAKSMLQHGTEIEEHSVDSGGPGDTLIILDAKTGKHDFACAAINPDLANMNDEEYIKRFAPRSHKTPPTITFKDLETWELWARQDPMHTGTMHYVAMVLPGCGEERNSDPIQIDEEGNIVQECQGGGDVDLVYCNWAKIGPENDVGYDIIPAEPCPEDAPWKDDPEGYRRTCGTPVNSPLIMGTAFKSTYDNVQVSLEKLRELARKIDDILDGKHKKGGSVYKLFAGGTAGPGNPGDPMPSLGDEGVRSYDATLAVCKTEYATLSDEDISGQPADHYRYYVGHEFSAWGVTPGKAMQHTTLGIISYGSRKVPKTPILWKDPRPEWEFYQSEAGELTGIRDDLGTVLSLAAFGDLNRYCSTNVYNNHVSAWHCACVRRWARFLKKLIRAKQKNATDVFNKYLELAKEHNKELQKLKRTIGADNVNPAWFVLDVKGDMQTITLPSDFVTFDKRYATDIDFSILSFGKKPIIGTVTSDIPGTTVMGVEITGGAPEGCVNNDSPDKVGSAGQHNGAGGFPETNNMSQNQQNNFGSFGTRNGTNRDGVPRAPGPSFLTQGGNGLEFIQACLLGDDNMSPSYGPANPYDPNQVDDGYAGMGQRQARKDWHGNTINGNDIRLIENCLIRAKNAPAVNNIVTQRPEQALQSGVLSRKRGYIGRTMTVLMRNNVIVHEFSSSAYPVESAIFPPDRGNMLIGSQPIINDIAEEPVVGNTLAGTYVQSTRTLTASGEWGLNLPSWVKRNSTIIFHTSHASSGISYKIDQRVSSSELILSAASNPGSNVGPGSPFDLRPKSYHGPVQIPGLNTYGYAISPITIKNQAANGAQLEVWMQNNTIIAHPDACLPEDNTRFGALRRGHGPRVSRFDNISLTGGPGTSGYLKSFTPKYIAVANITMSQPVITNPSGTYNNPPTNNLGPKGANTGFLESQVTIHMENNLICPVYNARLPLGKTYADDVTASSPKWDVVADIGIPVVNVVASGCVVSHGSVVNNVIVGRTVFDTDKNQYVQHPDDGDNILSAMDQTDNSDHPHITTPSILGYQWPFASGFSVYDGGPDDVFRSFYGPFYGDNLSDKHLSVTGKDDRMDSFTRQKSHLLQFSLNEDVLFADGNRPSVIIKTFAGIPPEVHGLGVMPPFDFGGTSSLSSNRVDITKSLPKSVVRPKFATMSAPDSLEFGDKAIIDSKTGLELKSTTEATINKPQHVGACMPPLSSEQEGKRRLPNPPVNINILCTVGQKKSNIKNGSYVNIDNGFNPAEAFPEVFGDRLKNDVIEYPNFFMPVTQGGMRVSSGGKNDRPVVGFNDLYDVEVHLGQTRDNVVEDEKAASNIDKLFYRFKSQDGHGTQQ